MAFECVDSTLRPLRPLRENFFVSASESGLPRRQIKNKCLISVSSAINKQMTDVSDMELVQAYLQRGSEEAFATLVRRHIELVYSAALRQTGIAAQAEEITQVVFILFARKAASLRAYTALEGWFYETTRLTALSFLRGERRRQFREQEAYMQSTLQDSVDNSTWNQMAPLLDEAMFRLRKKDRDAVVLRFFMGKNIREVAAALDVTEAAAQRRVRRAVEKLRTIFAKNGVPMSAALIANSVQAAPAGLEKTVSVVAFTKGVAASGSTLTLVKGASKIMAWTKAKTAAVIGAGVLLAAGTATVIVKQAIPPTAAAMYEAVFEHPTSLGMNLLESAPSTLIFRPTQFPKKIGRGFWAPSGKSVAVNFPLETLFSGAYGFRPEYVVYPDDFNFGNTNYDILITLPSHQNEALQEAFKERFGLTAHAETRETDVLLLKVADPAKLQLYKTKGGEYNNYVNVTESGHTEKIICRNAGLGVVADYVNVGEPVLDRSGTEGRYDFKFQWTDPKWLATDAGLWTSQDIWDAQLNRVGLELVSTNMPIKMLVVEKAP